MAPHALSGMLTPVFFAAANVHGDRHRPRDVDAVSLAAGMLPAAGGGFLPASLATGAFHPIWREVGVAGLPTGAHGLPTAPASVLFLVPPKRGGSVHVSEVACIITLTGIGWSMVFLGERHGVRPWLAAALMSVGVALVNRRPAAPPVPSAALAV